MQKNIFVSTIFLIQHTQIDLKSHKYRFYPDLHLTSLSWSPFQKLTYSRITEMKNVS